MAGEWAPNFLGGGSTVFSGTASHVCRESRATARECRSTRYRISIRNGGSFYGRTRRAEPRPRSKLRSRGVGSTTIPSAATTSTRWGSASFWDKTNLKVVTKPARNAEWGAEFYHNYVLFKGLWFTSDIQVHFAPALHPGAGPPSASGLPVRCAFSSHRTSIRVLFLRRHLRRTQRPPAGASKRAIGASRHCSTRSRAALAPIGRS